MEKTNLMKRYCRRGNSNNYTCYIIYIGRSGTHIEDVSSILTELFEEASKDFNTIKNTKITSCSVKLIMSNGVSDLCQYIALKIDKRCTPGSINEFNDEIKSLGYKLINESKIVATKLK